jgi:uncharacterized membrane protein
MMSIQKRKGGDRMVKSKLVLMVLGIIIILMGILGLLDIGMATEPSWHAILKIIIGLIALALGYMDKT